MRRSLVSALVLVLASPCIAQEAEDVTLPDVLSRHGFDDSEKPITIVFTGPVGDEAHHPRLSESGEVAPANTLWMFEDPTPVRRVLARAKTRDFSPKRFPGADARFILYAGEEGADARIYLHYRPGWGTVKADREKGGEWHFDPAADAALVDLLSETAPRAVGVPVRGVIEAGWKPDLEIEGPDFETLGMRGDWARLKRRLVPRYASSRLELPAWFSWDEHFVVVAWLPRRDTRDRLDWDNARLQGDVITWALREDPEGEEAKGWAPVTIGFFDKVPSRFTQFAMRLDGGVIKTAGIWPRMPMPGQPKPVGLFVPRDEEGVRLGMLTLLEDRTYLWEPDADDKEGSGVREGPIPKELVPEIWDGLGAWKRQPSQGWPRMHDARIDDVAGFPPGMRDLMAHLGLP